jgi:hypothetical protein
MHYYSTSPEENVDKACLFYPIFNKLKRVTNEQEDSLRLSSCGGLFTWQIAIYRNAIP